MRDVARLFSCFLIFLCQDFCPRLLHSIQCTVLMLSLIDFLLIANPHALFALWCTAFHSNLQMEPSESSSNPSMSPPSSVTPRARASMQLNADFRAGRVTPEDKQRRKQAILEDLAY